MAAADEVAVLTSGGLDSGVLLWQLGSRHRRVHALYVRSGLAWEEAELERLKEFVAGLPGRAPPEVRILDAPALDLYGGAWYASGKGAPRADDPDQAMEIPGRNVLLLSRAAVWCRLHGVGTIALATLRGNPFPDASAEFFREFSAALSRGLGAPIAI